GARTNSGAEAPKKGGFPGFLRVWPLFGCPFCVVSLRLCFSFDGALLWFSFCSALGPFWVVFPVGFGRRRSGSPRVRAFEAPRCPPSPSARGGRRCTERRRRLSTKARSWNTRRFDEGSR